MDLDRLDAERGGPFVVFTRGERVTLPSAAELPWETAAAAVVDAHQFALQVWPAGVPLTAWKIESVQRAWCAHQGLPEGEQVRRLANMLSRYGEGIEYDLQNHLGVNMGEMWRARKWRELLGLIDHLPMDTWYHQLLINDEEYIGALLDRKGADEGPAEDRPNQSDFSLTNKLLTILINEVRRGTATSRAIANPKASQPNVHPQLGPKNVIEKLRYEKRKRQHEELTALLLPGR